MANTTQLIEALQRGDFDKALGRLADIRRGHVPCVLYFGFHCWDVGH